ncbi:protein o-linked-mannose beta-1,4-n-acetylglucosaminyltransferase 2 [Plakobranchus ocellatus]|uniref:Protein O-linked-mannose beta-1,4-N-acetylglucosaminyltransferase 2 n=1 Tax=Plakobranchus ocellatus TaxID=259542 RepID=A0AAV3Y8L1_9GAST|nr:protein o-linked-mannose beta-1,4-n-acetylglucosaminyltransferase 2 [Plakobranchus ocellatus]
MGSPSFSLQTCLHVFLFVSVIVISGMYLRLRQKYTELNLSCQKSSPHIADGGTGSYSCAIACSDYCRNVARTEHDHISKTWPAFTADIKSLQTEAAASTGMEVSTSVPILPSKPAAYRTSEMVVTEPVKVHDESSAGQFNLMASSSVGFSGAASGSGFVMTSSLYLEKREKPFENQFFKAASASPNNERSHALSTTQPKNVENCIHYGKELKFSEASGIPSTGYRLGTIPATDSDSSNDQHDAHVPPNPLMHPTEFPLLQTRCSDSHKTPQHHVTTSSQANVFHDGPYETEQLVGAQIENSDNRVTEEIVKSKDSNGDDECQNVLLKPTSYLISDLILNELYDEDDYYYDDKDVEESSSDETMTYYFPSDLLVSGTTHTEALHRIQSHGTSVWCESVQGGEDFCHFQNLCFNIQERDFVFVLGEESLVTHRSISSVKTDENHFLTVNLSAVPDHNAHTFPLVFIPSGSFHQFKAAVIPGASFIMSRFKPDNVMHVLHDDLLPLIHTLHRRGLLLSDENTQLRLVLADLFDPKDNRALYSSIFPETPLSLLVSDDQIDSICFENSYTGLSQGTLWYQYGFYRPQGPLLVNASVLENVHRAVGYLASILETPCLFCSSGNYLVLLSRKDNRLIINEGDLVLSLVRSTKLKVMAVSLETHSIREIISILKGSKGILGMHGSLLIFGIFLQPGSIFIELFPYAINPSKYTPFKTFCGLPGSGIVYKSWSNSNFSKTVGHPYRSPDQGGIHHLSLEAQAEIVSQTEVPEHLCCEDPSWLYHIYQDTHVDVEAVVAMTTTALVEAASLITRNQRDSIPEVTHDGDTAISYNSESVLLKMNGGTSGTADERSVSSDCEERAVANGCHDNNYKGDSDRDPHLLSLSEVDDLAIRPAGVKGLSCEREMVSPETNSNDSDALVYTVTWNPPWNVKYTTFSSIHYEIVYQVKGQDSGKTVQLGPEDATEFSISTQSRDLGNEYFVWVRAVLDKTLAGPYQFISCGSLKT